MLLPAGTAHAAAFVPGTQEPDPPTGDTTTSAPAMSAAEPLAGSGIRWVLAPWRTSGTLSLDLRTQRQDDGTRSRQSLLFGDIDFASYIWQPWFIQLRAGLGLLVAHDRSNQDTVSSVGGGSSSLTGRFALSVFPSSRFPFELRTDVSDSRARGDALGAAYRSQRLSLSQGWRPAAGNENVHLTLDHSRLIVADGGTDTLTTLQAIGTHQRVGHSVDLGASFSRNERSDSAQQSRLAALSARHSYHPTSGFRVETLATQNNVRLRGADSDDIGSDVRQISTLVSWQPRESGLPQGRMPEGEARRYPDAPLQVTGSARWVEAGSSTNGASARVQAFNATLGVAKELSRTWRLAAAASLGRVDGDATPPLDNGSVSGSVTWAPAALSRSGWQYAPTVSTSGSFSQTSLDEGRRSASLQLAHSLSRSVVVGSGHRLALAVSQSAAARHDSGADAISKALAHSASMSWQSSGDDASQTVAGLTLSDSRAWARERGSFQLVNLQLTRRTQLSRSASWSANLTLQVSRNSSSELDPFSGQQRTLAPGWQQFHSGSLSYANQRIFGVPRLRFTALLAANSQQLERRSVGDIDAPLERISRSLEGRLDYAIGRLEARLIARQANVDGKSVSAVFARLQRRF